MKTLEDRKTAFENKFKYDQDMLFKINSKRARLVGLWAAEKLDIEDVDAYAESIIHTDIDEPHQNIVRKIEEDFKAKGLKISKHRIKKELEKQWEIARISLTSGEIK